MKAIDEWLQPELPEDKDDQLTSRFITRQVENEYKQTLQEKLASEYGISKEDQGHSGVRIFRLNGWKLWTTIAATLFACFIGLKTLIPSDNPSTLAAAYLESQDYFHPGSSKGTMEESTTREQIQLSFNEKRYDETAKLILQISQPTDEDKYYLALALMLGSKPVEAIPLFDALSSSNSRYAEAATWYKAISYMLNQQSDEAVLVLRTIEPIEWNYALAKKYIRQLK